jgi:hypothetical protein
MLPPAARWGNADACRCRVCARRPPSPQEERSDRPVRFKRSAGSRKSKIDIGRRASYLEGDFSSAIVESIPAKDGSGSSTRITWRLTHGTGTKESALETPDELVDAWSGSASVAHVEPLEGFAAARPLGGWPLGRIPARRARRWQGRAERWCRRGHRSTLLRDFLGAFSRLWIREDGVSAIRRGWALLTPGVTARLPVR